MVGISRAALKALVMTAAVPACPALAQNTVNQVETPAQREQQIQRQRGVDIGSFLLLPTLRADVSYDDNIFATADARQDDLIFNVQPAVALQSTFANHTLNVSAFASRSIYADTPDQDTFQYGAQADGTYAVSRALTLTGFASARHLVENRRSLGSYRISSDPVDFDDLEARVGAVYRSSSLFLNGEGRVRRVTYGDASIAGVRFDQNFRDFTITSGTVGGGYDFNGLTRIVLDFSAEQRRYDLRPGEVGFDPLTNLDRSADGYRVELGVQRELTALLAGTFRVGYFNFDYADAQLPDLSGFSYFGDLRWSVTPLTTLTLTASRRVDETISPDRAGNLRDEVTLGGTHELLRELFLQATVRAAWIDPVGTALKSREYAVDLSARYYFGEMFRLEAGYSRSARLSDDRAIRYRDNILFLALRIGL